MEADRRQPGATHQRLELKGREVAAPEWLACRVREDQVVAGQPATGRCHHLRLSVAVRAQDASVSSIERSLLAVLGSPSHRRPWSRTRVLRRG